MTIAEFRVCLAIEAMGAEGVGEEHLSTIMHCGEQPVIEMLHSLEGRRITETNAHDRRRWHLTTYGRNLVSA